MIASLVALLALPLVIAALLFAPSVERFALAIAPWAPLPIFIAALAAPLETTVVVPWLLLGAHFQLDMLALVFLSFSALIWLFAGLSIRAEIDEPKQARRLQAFHLLAMTGNFGLILAGDLATFYTCFSLLSFAGYGLVIHKRSREARRAARIYITFAVIGELMLFSGIVLAIFAIDRFVEAHAFTIQLVPAAVAQSPNTVVITVMLFGGAGVKAGAFGLHMWLPLAHQVAPTPSSAVLSSAMIEAGLFGWLRLLPLGVTPLPSLAAVFIAIGITAAFYGALIGLPQRDSKTILAYSSVSQMGLMTAAVGIAMAEPQTAPVAIAAAALFAVHHGFTKAALFLAVGVARRQLGRRARILVGVAIVLLALSIAGLPLTTGAIAKHAIKATIHDAELLTMILSLSSVVTAILMLRFLACLRAELGSVDRPATIALIIPWVLCFGLALASLWLLPWLDARRLAREILGRHELWVGTWPAALGVAIYVIAGDLARRTSLRLPAIPPGDLVVPLERALAAIRELARHARGALVGLRPRETVRHLGRWARAKLREFSARDRPSGWTSGVMLLAALVTILALLLAAG